MIRILLLPFSILLLTKIHDTGLFLALFISEITISIFQVALSPKMII